MKPILLRRASAVLLLLLSFCPALEPEARAQAPSPASALRLDNGTLDFVTDGFEIDSRGRVPGFQIVSVNRFTPTAAQLPLTLDAVSILFPLFDPGNSKDTLLEPGMLFEALVYVDPSGSGDPRNTTLVVRQPFALAPSDTVFQNVALQTPVVVTGGDVWVGFTNRVTATTNDRIFHSALDDQRPSQGRSWFFYNASRTGDHFDGADLGLARVGRTTDELQIPGNLMIRAGGQTGGGTVTLAFDPPEPPTLSNPFPPPRALRVLEPEGREGRRTPGTGVTAYKVYRSNRPNVQPTPGNLFATLPPTQTTVSSSVGAGTFYVVTACYGPNESVPSNEASGGVPAPRLTNVVITFEKVKATGTGFSKTVVVRVNNVAFSQPAKVKKKSKVTQKGTLADGRTLGEALEDEGDIFISFTNENGGVAAFKLLDKGAPVTTTGRTP